MKNQQDVIHIALAFDENFITPVYVLLTSIFLNNRENNLEIHVIATGVDEKEKQRIVEYTKLNKGKITFYDIDKSYNIEYLNTTNIKSTSFTIANYYRLFFPFLVPKNVKKILYLDVDIVVLNSLKSLYLTDITPFPIGAAPDKGMSITNDDEILEKIGIKKENYFNSGVILIDIDQWRKEKVFEISMEFLSNNQDILKYMDQDALNYALKDNWYKLSNLYNFCHPDISIDLPKKEILKNKIVILHYTSSKPWHFTNSARLRSYYYYYLKRSPHVKNKKYMDFKWTKYSFKGFIYIRILEFYLDHPWIRNILGKIKSNT